MVWFFTVMLEWFCWILSHWSLQGVFLKWVQEKHLTLLTSTLKKNYGTHVIKLDIAPKTHLFISASNNMFYRHSQCDKRHTICVVSDGAGNKNSIPKQIMPGIEPTTFGVSLWYFTNVPHMPPKKRHIHQGLQVL